MRRQVHSGRLHARFSPVCTSQIEEVKIHSRNLKAQTLVPRSLLPG